MLQEEKFIAVKCLSKDVQRKKRVAHLRTTQQIADKLQKVPRIGLEPIRPLLATGF
jgi:hypothetical protein